MNNLLNNQFLAKQTAEYAHQFQVDKAGDAYINHVIRVADAVTTVAEKTVAYLHDVIEDTIFTLDDEVIKIHTKEVIDAVNAITRKTNETYKDYISRVSKNKIATTVKIADIIDHLDHQEHISDTLVKRYLNALEILQTTKH